MMLSSKTTFLLRAAAVGLVLWLFASWLIIPKLIESAYQGASWNFLNNVISGQAIHPLEFYLSIANRYLFKASLFFLGFSIFVFIWSFNQGHFVITRILSNLSSILTKSWIAYFLTTSLIIIFFFSIVTSSSQLISYDLAAKYLIIFGFLVSSLLFISLLLKSNISAYDFLNLFQRVNLQPPAKQLSQKTVVICFILMMLLVMVSRLHTFAEAYERDLMVYMSIADRLLDGWHLYSVLWDHKPPAIHWTYAFFAALFGVRPLSLFLLGYTAFVITLFGCYQAGKVLGGKLAGILSCVVWTIISGDLFLQGNQPNVEVFMNCCLVWAIVLMLKEPRGRSFIRFACIGFLFFLASLYKTTAVTVPFLVLLTHFLFVIRNSNRDARTYSHVRIGFTQIIVSGVVAVTGWIIVFLGFFASDEFNSFKMAVFDYNRSYSGNLLKNIFNSFFPDIWPMGFYTYLWLFITALVLLISSSARLRHRKAGILLAYFIGTYLSIALPGKYYPHYFQLLFPPIAIATGWLGAAVFSINKKSLTIFYCALLLLPLFVRTYQYFIPVEEIPVVKYGTHGSESLETKEMGEWINDNFDKDATIYNWGAEPGVYFWSQRSSPTGFVYNFPLTTKTEMGRNYIQMQLDELEVNMPDLIVAKRSLLENIDHPIEEWMMRKYILHEGPPDIKHFIFLVPADKNSD